MATDKQVINTRCTRHNNSEASGPESLEDPRTATLRPEMTQTQQVSLPPVDPTAKAQQRGNRKTWTLETEEHMMQRWEAQSCSSVIIPGNAMQRSPQDYAQPSAFVPATPTKTPASMI